MLIVIEKDMKVQLPSEFTEALHLKEHDILEAIYDNQILRISLIMGMGEEKIYFFPYEANENCIQKSESQNLLETKRESLKITKEKIRFIPNRIKINCFQSMELIFDGKQVKINNRKAEELLAYLICNGHLVHKEQLAEILWPETSPEKARDNLYKACAYLRNLQKKGVPVPLNITRGSLYVDTGKLDCDFIKFDLLYERGDKESLIELERIYRGPLLAENCYEWTVI